MTNVPAIRAEGLTKYFGPVIGIEDLSFEVAQGEVYGFLGANGAGKTTTIRLLLDLSEPGSPVPPRSPSTCARLGISLRVAWFSEALLGETARRSLCGSPARSWVLSSWR